MSARNRCPHSNLRPIYGDEIIFATPKFSRLQCRNCGKYLDGPVSLAYTTKPTITESRYRFMVEGMGFDFKAGFNDALGEFGIEVIPDPEPTDEELLAGIIRNIDDWQSITSPELLAKYLNTAGVTPPKEDK